MYKYVYRCTCARGCDCVYVDKLCTTDLLRAAEVSWRERFSRQFGVLLSGTMLPHSQSHSQLFVACRMSLAVWQATKSWAWD